MPRPRPLPEKARWLILVAGLTASIPLYAVVVFVLATTGAPAAAAPITMLMAAISDSACKKVPPIFGIRFDI